jgi:hypothetical protein
MRLLNLAATSSLAALVLTLGVDQLKADHEGWSGNQRGWGPRVRIRTTRKATGGSDSPPSRRRHGRSPAR